MNPEALLQSGAGLLLDDMVRVLHRALDWFGTVGADQTQLAELRALAESGLFINPRPLREFTRRAYATSRPEGFLWVEAAGNTSEYLMARMPEMLPRHLGGPLSILWSDDVRARLDTLGKAFMADPNNKPEDARKALDVALDKPLRKAVEAWLLHRRQASGTIRDAVNPYAGEDYAVFPRPTELRVQRKLHPLPIPDTDPLTAEIVAADFFLGDDPDNPRMPGGYALVDAIAAARFAPDRRKAFVWLQMLPGFGKGMFLGALHRIGVVAHISQSEIEKALSGAAVGIDPRNLLNAWVLAINEFHGLKRELKELENTLRCSPKYKSEHEMPVFMKLFLSAEDNLAMIGAGGVEEQYADRFSYLCNPAADMLDFHPLLMQLGQQDYCAALAAWIGARLWSHVERYRALGPGEGARHAAADLHAFWSEHSITRSFDTLGEVMDEHAEAFAQWAHDAWRRGDHGRAGFDVVTLDIKGETRHVLTNPTKAFTVWLASPGHDPAFRATIGKRRRTILETLDYKVHRAGDKLIRGCRLDRVEDTLKKLPEAVRLVVDNGVSKT